MQNFHATLVTKLWTNMHVNFTRGGAMVYFYMKCIYLLLCILTKQPNYQSICPFFGKELTRKQLESDI